MLTRIRDVFSLTSIHDEQMRISVCCTPSWTDHRRSVHDKDDGWRGRESVAFARSLWVHLARRAGPLKVTPRQHSSFTCAADITVELSAGEDFLVKHRVQNLCEHENFLYVEGPLVEVNWSKEKGSWSF
jgi:hypothetical protein